MVDPAGWRLAHFREAPRVLANHDYNIESIIGKGVDTKIDGAALVSTTQFDTEGLGAVAFRLVQAGMANTWSVGWMGLRSHQIGSEDDCEQCAAVTAKNKNLYGTHYTQQDLLEYSLVAIPANPDAVMRLATAGLVGRAEADAWIASVPMIEATPEPEPEHDEEIVMKAAPLSAAAYEKLFAVSRNLARYADARRLSQQIGRTS